MKGSISRITLVAIVVLAMTVGSAMAAKLEGTFALGGSGGLSKLGDTGNLLWDFNQAQQVVFFGGAGGTTVFPLGSATEKDYFGIGVGYTDAAIAGVGKFREADYTWCTVADPGLNVSRIGAVDGYSFTLLEITSYNIDDSNADNPQLLRLIGTALVKHAGYEDTVGTWDFSISQNNATQTEMSWHATFTSYASDPPVVPEPTTMLLFGTGLLGIAAIARRNNKK